MPILTFTISTSKALNKLDNLAKQSRFANARTLSTLAIELKSKELPQKMNQTFEGVATAYTRRAFKYETATKSKPYSVVSLRDTHNYLRYQFKGGTRYPEKKKLFIPTALIRKNKYGNVPKASRQNLFVNKKKYFVGQPDKHSPVGAYQRMGRKGRGGRKPVALFIRSAKYTATLNLHKMAEQYVNKHYAKHFKNYLNYALRSKK